MTAVCRHILIFRTQGRQYAHLPRARRTGRSGRQCLAGRRPERWKWDRDGSHPRASRIRKRWFGRWIPVSIHISVSMSLDMTLPPPCLEQRVVRGDRGPHQLKRVCAIPCACANSANGGSRLDLTASAEKTFVLCGIWPAVIVLSGMQMIARLYVGSAPPHPRPSRTGARAGTVSPHPP
jgi:hypothetical protein